MKKTLYILKGLPASGKSTWAKNKAAEEPNTIIVNRDKIREMLKGEYKLFPFGSKLEVLVTEIENKATKNGLHRGYNVIVDATNFRTNTTDFGINLLKETYDCEVEVIDFTHIPLKLCIQRDQQREYPVGKEVIERMYNRYLKDGNR